MNPILLVLLQMIPSEAPSTSVPFAAIGKDAEQHMVSIIWTIHPIGLTLLPHAPHAPATLSRERLADYTPISSGLLPTSCTPRVQFDAQPNVVADLDHVCNFIRPEMALLLPFL